MSLRLAATLALLAAAPAVGAAEHGTKVFRDWVAGCDNLRQCTALSLPGETAETISYLRLVRPGDPDAAASLSLNLRDTGLKKQFAARLSVDGAPFRSLPGTSVDGESGEIELPAADGEALIAAARKGARLEIAVDDKRYALSLAGAVAALLWIDEQQGRLGTVTALIRKGDKPATSLAAAPAMPILPPRPTTGQPALSKPAGQKLAAELRAHLKRTAPDECSDVEEGSSDSDSVWPLGSRSQLVALLCYRGAYNSGSGYWIVEPGKLAAARRVAFPTPAGKPQTELVNSSYDPASGMIDFFSKGRGPADCGSAGIYVWTGAGFALASWSEMSVCRGLPPDEWISLFRSESKPR
jgi:hypothetical protein